MSFVVPPKLKKRKKALTLAYTYEWNAVEKFDQHKINQED
jgi:hypothetical protein